MLASILTSYASAGPETVVPWHKGPIDINKVFSDKAWSPSSQISSFTAEGGKTSTIPKTTVYLAYDAEFLYVAAIMEETEPGLPISKRRQVGDNLTKDDAFQVVLGLRDGSEPSQDTLKLGGYPGALDTPLATADSYYQFTVNAAGNESRSYNETPLERALFTSSVKKKGSEWVVQLRIPFSSIGLKNPRGQTVLANFFRFRPPAKVAWTLPAYGGYNAMPFGAIKLQAKEEEYIPIALVSGGGPIDRTIVETKVENTLSDELVKAGIQARFEYYPLSGAIVTQLTHPNSEQWKAIKAEVEVDGQVMETRQLSANPSETVVTRIQAGSQPARTAKVKISRPEGSTLFEKEIELPAVEAPVWFGTEAGKKYVDEAVPLPWKEPVLQGETVTLAHNAITIGKYGLFTSIVDEFGDLLNGDSTIEIVRNGAPLKFENIERKLTKDGYHIYGDAKNISGGDTLETKVRMDYDGFSELKFRLNTASPENIERITVKVPLNPEVAKFAHRVLVQDVEELNGLGIELGEGPLWIGNQDKGINFSYDVDPFLSKNNRSRIRVVQNDQKAVLEIDLVDEQGQLKESDHVFRFFLQPTPSKPRLFQHGYDIVRFKWEQWTNKQGEIDLSKMGEIKKWTSDLAKEGLVGALYTTQGLASDSEDWINYSQDLGLQPKWMCYRRGYEPGMNVPVYATCKRGPDGDRVLYGLKEMIDNAQIGGICDDGMSLAWLDENPGHRHGCGDQEPITMEKWEDTRITGQRTFLKRVRGIFDETRKPFVLSAHAGGGLDIGTLSFFDGYMEGEQLVRFPNDYRIPLEKYAIGYNGYPWGFRTRLWDKLWRTSKGPYWSYSYVLLHGGDYEDTTDVYQMLKDFQDPLDSKFYPYWRSNDQFLNVASERSKVSFFRSELQGLVVVSNLSYKTDQIKIDFSKFYPGKNVVVYDSLSHSAVVPMNEAMIIQRELLPWQCAVYRIRLADDHAEEQEALWQTSDQSLNYWLNKENRNAATPESHDSKSFLVGNSNSEELSGLVFASDSKLSAKSGSLVLSHTGRLRFKFGDTEVEYDGSAWIARGLLEGRLFQPSLNSDGDATVAFSTNQGTLQMSYNNQPLIAGRIADLNVSGFTLETWAGDSVRLKGWKLSSLPKPIFKNIEGVYELKALEEVKPFKMDKFVESEWQVENGTSEVLSDGKSPIGLKISSKTTGAASKMTLDAQTFGQDGVIALWVKSTGRLRIEVGGSGLEFHDKTCRLVGDPAGWSTGKLTQPLHDFREKRLVTIGMNNGIWTVTCGNQVILKNATFSTLQDSGNKLTISTWAGDVAEVSIGEISSQKRDLIVEGVAQPIL